MEKRKENSKKQGVKEVDWKKWEPFASGSQIRRVA